MPHNPADTRQELTAEMARLERELEADTRWCELAAIEAAGPLVATAGRRIELECDLSDSPVYVARLKILEALATLPSACPADTSLPTDTSVAASEVRSDATWTSAVPDAPGPVAATRRESIASRIAPLVPAPAAGEPEADDLTKIKGIGPEIAGWLAAAGVRHYAEIASWTAADVARFRVELGVGRAISRDNWIEQAALLARKAGGPAAEPEPLAPMAPAADPDAGALPASPPEAEPVRAVIEAAGDAVTVAHAVIEPAPPPPSLETATAEVPRGQSAAELLSASTEPDTAIPEAGIPEAEAGTMVSMETPAVTPPSDPPMAEAPVMETPATETLVERLDRLDELAAAPAPVATGPLPRAFIRDNGLSRIMARRRTNQLLRESLAEAGGAPPSPAAPPVQAGVSFVRPSLAAPARSRIPAASPPAAVTTPPLQETSRSPPPVTAQAATPHRFKRPLAIAPDRSGEAEFREWAQEASVEIVRKDVPKRQRPGLAQSLATTPAIGRFIRALKGEE